MTRGAERDVVRRASTVRKYISMRCAELLGRVKMIVSPLAGGLIAVLALIVGRFTLRPLYASVKTEVSDILTGPTRGVFTEAFSNWTGKGAASTFALIVRVA